MPLAGCGYAPRMRPDSAALRPFERRVRGLAAAGMSRAEIGRRFRRQPETIDRVLAWSDLPREGRPAQGDVLRPVERRVLRWREDGTDFQALAPRLRRTPEFLEQVARLALHKPGRTRRPPRI